MDKEENCENECDNKRNEDKYWSIGSMDNTKKHDKNDVMAGRIVDTYFRSNMID